MLLLEAGPPDDVDEVRIPAAFYRLFKTERDWDFATEEQKQLHGRRLYWPRGRMLGGCSSLNAMIYVRGSRLDYDGWRDDVRRRPAGASPTCCRTSGGPRTTPASARRPGSAARRPGTAVAVRCGSRTSGRCTS